MNAIGAVLAMVANHPTELVIERVGTVAARSRPPWWRWATYLAVGMTIHRTRQIRISGRDPFATLPPAT